MCDFGTKIFLARLFFRCQLGLDDGGFVWFAHRPQRQDLFLCLYLHILWNVLKEENEAGEGLAIMLLPRPDLVGLLVVGRLVVWLRSDLPSRLLADIDK